MKPAEEAIGEPSFEEVPTIEPDPAGLLMGEDGEPQTRSDDTLVQKVGEAAEAAVRFFFKPVILAVFVAATSAIILTLVLVMVLPQWALTALPAYLAVLGSISAAVYAGKVPAATQFGLPYGGIGMAGYPTAYATPIVNATAGTVVTTSAIGMLPPTAPPKQDSPTEDI